MSNWFSQQSDYLLFALVAIGAMVVLTWIERRTPTGRRLTLVGWATLVLILSIGWIVVDRDDRRERHEMVQSFSGMAPTYASELARLGHATIGLSTAKDDPHYLALIETEIRWLKFNPGIADIYTMRRGADGRPYFVVDSETDYDRNGRYEGDRESRTVMCVFFPSQTRG